MKGTTDMAIVENKELTTARMNQRQRVTDARLEREIARLEYVAMMADVELDDDDEAEGFNQGEEIGDEE